MGWKYEVTIRVSMVTGRGYEDKDAYRGPSLFVALYTMWCFRKVSACTTLKVR